MVVVPSDHQSPRLSDACLTFNLSPVPPRSASGEDHLQAVLHAPVANVNDAGAKRLRLDQLQVDPFVEGREVGRAAAE